MCPTVKAPGPVNQKSVPGPSQRAEIFPPGATCSASMPRAIAPLAWITTPPGAGVVTTAWPLGAGEGFFAGVLPWVATATAFTLVTDTVPGWVRLTSGEAVIPILLTTARPDPTEPGLAI